MTVKYDTLLKHLNKLPKKKQSYGIPKQLKQHISTFLISSKYKLTQLYENLELEQSQLNNLSDVIKIKPLKLSSKKLTIKNNTLKLNLGKKRSKMKYTGGAYNNVNDDFFNLFQSMKLNNNNNINNDFINSFQSLKLNKRNRRKNTNSYHSKNNSNNNKLFELDLDKISPYELGVVFITLYHYYVSLLLNIRKWVQSNLTIQNFKLQKEKIVNSRTYKFLSYLIYFFNKTLCFIWWVLNLPIIRPISYAFTSACIIYYYRWEIFNLMWYYGEEPLMYFIQNTLTEAIKEQVIQIAKETALKSTSELVPQLALQAGTNAAKLVTQQALEQVPQLVNSIATETASQIAYQTALQTGQELSKETLKLAAKAATEAAIEAAKIASQKAIEEAATEATRNRLISEASTMAIQAALAKFFPAGLAALGSATTLALGI